MRGKGRHDPCVLPRAAPMVEVRKTNAIVFRPRPLFAAVSSTLSHPAASM